MTIQLRSYQDASIEALRNSIRRGRRAPLLVSPTGSGKTVIFSYLTSRLVAGGKRVVILNHRAELTEQISRALNLVEVRHGIIAAGMAYDRRPLAHVASVMTVVRRLAKTEVPDYVVIDEAHHCIAGSTWGKTISEWRIANPKLLVIGVTATPERLDGTGLGKMFDDMVLGPTTAQLIADGWLSPYKLFAPPKQQQADLSGVHTKMGDFVQGESEAVMDKPAIIGSAVSHYRQHCNGAPAVAFCVSVKHAQHVAEQFQAEGFRAASIDGTMDGTTRRNIIRDFSAHRLHLMTSCDLVSEGFDVPGMVGALLLRPTQSLALNLQQVGRSLRICDGKTHAVILDHVGNSARHGLPDDDREWSLEGREKKKKTKDPDDVAIKQCKKCYAISRATALVCRECGHPFEGQPRVIAEKEGELQEVDPKLERLKFIQDRAAAQDLDELIKVGKLRGFNNPVGWAKHILSARAEKRAKRERA
jgi:superfamily II DNA or RNA helicase